MANVIKYPEGMTPESFLRNGSVRTTALDVLDCDYGPTGWEHVRLTPWSSRGEPASGFIALPRDPDTLAALIRELREVHNAILDQKNRDEGIAGRQAWVNAAIENSAREGELEIDDDATVSDGCEAGAYVQSWVWVSQSDLIPPKGDQPLNVASAIADMEEDKKLSLYQTVLAVVDGEGDQHGDTMDIVSAAESPEEAFVKAETWARANIPLCDGMCFERRGKSEVATPITTEEKVA